MNRVILVDWQVQYPEDLNGKLFRLLVEKYRAANLQETCLLRIFHHQISLIMANHIPVCVSHHQPH